MRLSEAFKIAIFALSANKIHSFLAMLGIVIGISAVIVMVSIGQGVQDIVLSEIETMGHNLAFIIPGGMKQEKGIPQFSFGTMTIKTLKNSDASALKKQGFYIKEAIPLVFGSCILGYKGDERRKDFIGTLSQYQKMRGNEILEGRFFSESEERSMKKVVVIGEKVKEKMFGGEDPIGKVIKINRKRFKIIGVIKIKGLKDPTFDLNERVFIPLSVAQKEMLGIDYVNAILMQAKSADTLDLAVEEARLILRNRHKIKDPQKDDFAILSQSDIASSFNLIGRILTIFLACVASISLIVGGVGIMNIMLVAVAERTREIGLRKAVGAKNKDILLQFLLEAVCLTVFGGVIGVLLGILGSYFGGLIIGKILGAKWSFTFSLISVILGFGISTFIGLFFGIYPAQKASKLSPIEALRYE